MEADILDKRLRAAELFDVYGALLTDKQREAMRLCYEEDLSLSEIAEAFDTSRQAAADLLKRSVALLEYYESELGIAESARLRAEAIGKLELLLRESGSEQLRKQALPLLKEIGR